MGEMNKINGDFSSFINSLTKDIDLSNNKRNVNNEKKENMADENNTIKNLDIGELSKIIEKKLNKLKEIFKGEARFEVNKEADMVVVKIIDKDSKKVIRQIPSETAVKMAEMLDKLEGIFLDERV
ncbi:flagellar protein FlaG [Marinitoga arctica]